MKKTVILLALSLAAYNCVEAQTQTRKVKTKTANGQTTKVREQVVDPGTSDKTIVEVRDGQVLVNGEAVTDNPNARIIVKNSARRPAMVTVNTKEVSPRLGIYAVDDDQGGALVADVDANGPAAAVGLRSGDVIIKINNTLIGNSDELASFVARQRNGEELIIYYDRNDRSLRSTVVLGNPISSPTAVDEEAPSFNSSSTYTGELPRPGIFNDEHLNLPDNHPLGIRGAEVDRGIRVFDVANGSAADRAGIIPGDIIIRIDGMRVINAGDIGRILRHSNNLVPIDFLRDGERHHSVLRY